MSMPYRKPGEPAPVPREHRRWFTKSAVGEKGPFEASAILLSLKEGYLTKSALVRAEDETEWQPLGGVYELALAPAVRSRPSIDEPAAPRVPAGNYPTGFVLGIFLGVLGLIIAYIRREPETLRGARNGFLARVGFVIVVAVLASLFR